MSTKLQIEIEDDVVIKHFGMAFDENGREFGNVVIVQFCYYSNGWSNYVKRIYSIKSGKCIPGYPSESSKVSPTGRQYKWYYDDVYGNKIFIE